MFEIIDSLRWMSKEWLYCCHNQVVVCEALRFFVCGLVEIYV